MPSGEIGAVWRDGVPTHRVELVGEDKGREAGRNRYKKETNGGEGRGNIPLHTLWIEYFLLFPILGARILSQAQLMSMCWVIYG